MNDLVLTNMDLVLQDSVVRGSLRIKGGVITDVMERSGAVTIRTRTVDGWQELIVEDDGAGFRPDTSVAYLASG